MSRTESSTESQGYSETHLEDYGLVQNLGSNKRLVHWYITHKIPEDFLTKKDGTKRSNSQILLRYCSILNKVADLDCYIIQMEESPKTKSLHVHVALSLTHSNVSPHPYLIEEFPTAKIKSVPKPGLEKVRRYCAKSETRVLGPIFEGFPDKDKAYSHYANLYERPVAKINSKEDKIAKAISKVKEEKEIKRETLYERTKIKEEEKKFKKKFNKAEDDLERKCAPRRIKQSYNYGDNRPEGMKSYKKLYEDYVDNMKIVHPDVEPYTLDDIIHSDSESEEKPVKKPVIKKVAVTKKAESKDEPINLATLSEKDFIKALDEDDRKCYLEDLAKIDSENLAEWLTNQEKKNKREEYMEMCFKSNKKYFYERPKTPKKESPIPKQASPVPEPKLKLRPLATQSVEDRISSLENLVLKLTEKIETMLMYQASSLIRKDHEDP